MVENVNKFNCINVNMQVESQTDLNMVEKEPMVHLLGFNLLSKEKKRKPFDFDVNVDLNLLDEQTLQMKLSQEKTDVPLKEKEKTTFPFALFGEILISIWKIFKFYCYVKH